MEEILARRETIVFHEVKLLKVSVEERTAWVLNSLKHLDRFGLIEQLRQVPDRMVWVATFLALLELTRQGRIKLDQNEPFEEIYVARPEAIDVQAA